MKYTLLFAIFITLVFTTCTKYPDGGNNASSIDGTYTLNELKVNGVDSLASINFPVCTPYYIFFGHFIFDKTTIDSGCDTMPTTTWVRSTDKKHITITCVPTPGGKPVYPIFQNRNSTIIWDIQRLTGEDFWIKTIYNGKEYYLKFAYYH